MRTPRFLHATTCLLARTNATIKTFLLPIVAVPRWISGKVSGDRPPPCSYYSLTLVDCKRAVMVGGNTPTGRINDVYIITLDGINVV